MPEGRGFRGYLVKWDMLIDSQGCLEWERGLEYPCFCAGVLLQFVQVF
jgi:hypothetical protein